ncbi:MAG: phycobilisome rod-core linker polypeptide [Pleurocapsa sp. MO_192.B19]|nr:phycobilisome rod-core linker polypeptide [Pleurocapsa sp. MO_192.B19]
MVSTFISPVISRASELGVGLYEDTKPVELCPNDSVEAVETVIRAVYCQVLGNAYVMESEKLNIPESKLKEGSISVREFIRQVAQSELYKSRFFDNCPRYRFIELNFKHLLGRAPDSYEETNAHSQILDQGGYAAEINSYLDSDEYQNKFGDNIVPYYCGYKTQTGKNIVGFTHLFKLLRGASSSDKKLTSKNEPRLTSSLINNRPSAIVPPSNISSYGGVTDINKLLANALKLPQTQTPTLAKNSTSNQFTSYSAVSSKSYSNVEEKYKQQQQKIEQLQQKLSSLSSFASIGASETSKWQSTGMSGANIGYTSYGNQQSSSTAIEQQDISRKVAAQQQTIADLEQKIADAQRLAAIGEARLNKWRRRVFF